MAQWYSTRPESPNMKLEVCGSVVEEQNLCSICRTTTKEKKAHHHPPLFFTKFFDTGSYYVALVGLDSLNQTGLKLAEFTCLFLCLPSSPELFSFKFWVTVIIPVVYRVFSVNAAMLGSGNTSKFYPRN